MNNTRRQHVVSDLHLRQWANEDGQVWALDLNTSKLFCTNTKNICVRRDYHEFEADIELPYSIEEVLAEEIEGPAAKPMLGLADGLLDPLTPEDIDNLCVYFGYLASRTPFTHQKMNKLAIKLHQKKSKK